MAARKGNKNAFKHGIYSRVIAVDDEEDMAGMSDEDTKDELALARARLANALTECKDCIDPKDKLGWDYACRHWTEIIAGMKFRNVDKRQTENIVFTSLIEAVRAANDKQNVIR
jgi:hypothetical protein